jgi:hypothetical protein
VLDNFRRNQIMGHVCSAIYKHYVSQIVGDDVVAAILGVSDRNTLIMNVGQMSFNRDPSAPTEFDRAEARKLLKNDPMLQELQGQRHHQRLDLLSQYGTFKKAESAVPEEYDGYQDLRDRVKARKNSSPEEPNEQ